MWVLGVLMMVVVATVTAVVAESKGQPPLLWFFIGLVFPLLGLIVAAVMPATELSARPGARQTPAEAALRRPVAQELGTHHLPVPSERLVHNLELSEQEVGRELAELLSFGLAEQDHQGRWSLTESGRFAAEWLGSSPQL